MFCFSVQTNKSLRRILINDNNILVLKLLYVSKQYCTITSCHGCRCRRSLSWRWHCRSFCYGRPTVRREPTSTVMSCSVTPGYRIFGYPICFTGRWPISRCDERLAQNAVVKPPCMRGICAITPVWPSEVSVLYSC